MSAAALLLAAAPVVQPLAVEGTRFLTTLAREGVHVRVLTNALEATDVPPAHAGYLRRRGTLLGAGIQLYELRRQMKALTGALRQQPDEVQRAIMDLIDTSRRRGGSLG